MFLTLDGTKYLRLPKFAICHHGCVSVLGHKAGGIIVFVCQKEKKCLRMDVNVKMKNQTLLWAGRNLEDL